MIIFTILLLVYADSKAFYNRSLGWLITEYLLVMLMTYIMHFNLDIFTIGAILIWWINVFYTTYVFWKDKNNGEN